MPAPDTPIFEFTPQWAKAFTDAGMVNPHTGEPSLQALSRATGLHPTTLSRIISGETTRPKQSTVIAIAQALRLDIVTVGHWIGQEWETTQPYIPPQEAMQLTRRQRRAVTELIRAMVTPE